ncbi:uncharacterized protein zgc:66455 [Melanotaenia boesemani]|uniref:uncharacterized protein zgc:66455 n=1 Tax=Melanotaenia boesemani TaxID=1250792 RepID=UPI001C05470A|nr:uncharacterized protein zgc:66455 [Melanotaenia boesemani]
MLPKSNWNLTSALLTFLLMFSIFWRLCGAQGNTEGATRLSDGHGGDGSAFFALRSCHQLLRSDSGEFFSPDYLCSNPPLWCNWTIQVDPEKRIHLHLEDLTPDETCQLKQDQIHVDEPAGHLGGHKVLQRCWQEAKYTSSSNTLYVVLLIGGWPSPSYRGFYGRYQAFGPPVVYNPREGFAMRRKVTDPTPALAHFADIGSVMNSEQMEVANSDAMYDYYDQHLAMTAGLPWESDAEEVGENLYPSSENYSHVYQFLAAHTVPPSTQRTFRSGRGTAHSHLSQSDSAVLPSSPLQKHVGHRNGLKRSTNTSSTAQSNVVEDAAAEGASRPQSTMEVQKTAHTSEQAREDNGLKVSKASDHLLPPSDGPEPQQTDPNRPRPNVVEQRSDHRGNFNRKNLSEIPHLPGDHLFEVAVEVNFSQDLEESWDNLARLLLLSVKASISKQLDALQKQLSLSSKRIKRLNAGALYILWLQIGQEPGGVHVHRAVHSAMQGLLATGISLRVHRRNAVVMSVSTADVNECGTQLVLCDMNAECVNHFGTYSCHCRPGFQDESRLGSGGTICVDTEGAGCSSGPSSETKGVYALFFLLSSLILTLLVVAGMLYHRHHRGAFLVRCQSSSNISPPDPNNNHHHPDDSYSSPTEPDLPPPPPPARGARDGWAPVKERCPPVDLPLLRFSPLLPPDGYTDPHDAGKM